MCFVGFTKNCFPCCDLLKLYVIKKVNTLIEEEYLEELREGTVTIFSIGKKGSEFFKSNAYKKADLIIKPKEIPFKLIGALKKLFECHHFM